MDYLRNDHFVPVRNRYFLILSVISLWLCVLVAACKQPESIEQDHLYGHWEISRAERNGKETGYLRNGYFIINRDGTMTVNITGEDETDQFLLDNNKIMMAGHKTFEIKSLQPDSLTMKYVMNSNTQFIFQMKRKQEDVQ